jgi:hypothetical protein
LRRCLEGVIDIGMNPSPHPTPPPAGGGSKGKLLGVAFLGVLLMGLSALIALVGLESGPIGNAFVPPGTTAESLPAPGSEGAKLVVHHCSKCHNLPSPELHSAEAWPYVVERMKVQMRAQFMGQAPIPSEEATRTIVEYLQAHARPSASAPQADRD